MTLIIKKSKLSNTLPNHKRATIWRSSGFSFSDQHIWSNNFYSCWIPSLFKSIPPASLRTSSYSRFYSTSQWVSEVLWHHSRHTNNASAINSSWTDWFLFAGSHFRTTWHDTFKYIILNKNFKIWLNMTEACWECLVPSVLVAGIRSELHGENKAQYYLSGNPKITLVQVEPYNHGSLWFNVVCSWSCFLLIFPRWTKDFQYCENCNQ